MRPTEVVPSSQNDLAPLGDQEFALFQNYIRQWTGIHLNDTKKEIFAVRLGRRLRQLGMRNYGEYFRLIHERAPGEMGHFLECVAIHETRFFRDPEQLRHLEKEIIPAWKRHAAAGDRPHRIRVWSAACSTGEEPYSIAMILAAALPKQSWVVEILASDISHQTLEIARKGVWPIRAADHIPANYRQSHMLRGVRDQIGLCKAGEEIRSMIRFEAINLNDLAYPIEGAFDLIFCRHVTLYFDVETTRRVVGQLCRYLSPDGYLFMGETEILKEHFPELKSPYPAVYTRGEAS